MGQNVPELPPKLTDSNLPRVYARPSNDGFFGLTELQYFMKLNVEPYIKIKLDSTLVMDFSSVKRWDISALLWLIVALDYCRSAGLSFLLRLPEGKDGVSGEEQILINKSADYLRRWRFDRGLKALDADLTQLLVPEQADYFDPPEPRKYYNARTLRDESGLLQALVSKRLAEIRALSELSSPSTSQITASGIAQCIKDFQAERIGEILVAQCGIEKRTADLFSDHLLTEALLNVQQHPKATLGFVAISVSGDPNQTHELILSVVDNGDSIPQTVYPRYLADKGQQVETGGAEPYDRKRLKLNQRSAIVHHATLPGVTSKPEPNASSAGMGLTYIKEDTIRIFKGKFQIVTDSTMQSYEIDPEIPPTPQQWDHGWRGNLLRIAIPIPATREPKSSHV